MDAARTYSMIAGAHECVGGMNECIDTVYPTAKTVSAPPKNKIGLRTED